MTTETSGSMPPDIESIGKIHFIGGILNAIGGLALVATWAVVGLILTMIVIGPLLWCFMPFALASAIVGICEVLSGSKHKKHVENPSATPITPPKGLAIGQIVVGFLSFNVLQLVLGIMVFMKLKKPEVVAYYESQAS